MGEHGELLIQGLPLEPGQIVDVVVLPRGSVSSHDRESLRDSVLKYDEPFEPVASEDWEAIR